LRKRLLLDVSAFRRVIARAGRLRNAIAHGGHVERGGLATCVDQAMRSATQLCIEMVEAINNGCNPQDHLTSMRERYTDLVDNSNEDPEAVLSADRAST
jgi:hypothetical protein